MVVPFEHANELDGLSQDTLLSLMLLTRKAENVLRKVLQAQGFNIGINLGKAAGAGIDDHLHMHIVPRWAGDTNFMPVLADTKIIPQHIQAHYDLLLPLPLYLILILTFIISGLVYTLILLPSWMRDKMEIRRLRRRIKDLEEIK